MLKSEFTRPAVARGIALFLSHQNNVARGDPEIVLIDIGDLHLCGSCVHVDDLRRREVPVAVIEVDQ